MTSKTAMRAAILILVDSIAILAFSIPDASAQTFEVVTDRGQSVADLFTLALVLASVAFAAVVGVLIYILVKFRRRGDDVPPIAPGPEARVKHRWELGWIIGMVLVFGFLGVLMIRTIRIVTAPAPASAMTVEIIGHQWWWEFHYPDADVVTANELHLPADTPLHFELKTDNVIHSFWMPDFGWKMDAVPNRANTMNLELNRTGVFTGACSEFCGAQHAWMRLRVVSETPVQFDEWLHAQQLPAVDPQSAIAQQSLRVFLENSCVSCHAIRFSNGATTPGTVGPNLTHLASRETIGAGVALNTHENLGSWIRNADDTKPQILMPAFPNLSDDDLDALVKYLEGLK